MESVENPASPPFRALHYWRLWLLDAVLVSAGLLVYLAVQYGTFDYFGTACLMAVLPFIPVIVLVGGGGSWVFILTKERIEKRSLKSPAAMALLIGPGAAVFAICIVLAAGKSPASRLAYICHGNVPASVSQVRVTGYSTFLGEEWLAVFNVDPKDFQTMVTRAELIPADSFEFKRQLDKSSLKNTSVFPGVPTPNDLTCYRRIFKSDTEHERGSIYAEFDPATATAAVFRQYHD